ncbi:ATP-binding protein [Skermanella pratensis]|uniref:ATP-binding protein n=1 Tax=Skermanella pratensis TaxID=2233999 RepID=UPI0013011D08|nr:ATP-binding protein [Skermanella pratensis]
MLLTGSPEVGKSRLVRELAARQEARGTVCAVVPDAGTAAKELTRLEEELSRKASPQGGIAAPVPRALLVVDGVDALDGAALERFALLTRRGTLALLLAGRTGLIETLVRSASKTVRGAITARVHLDPLDDRAAEDFIAALIASRGEVAGIAPDTVRRIVAQGNGIPGEIERLTADAITLARASRAVHMAATVEPASEFPTFQPLDLTPAALRPDPSRCLTAAPRSMQDVLEDLRTRAATAPRAGCPKDRDALSDPPARTLPSRRSPVQPEPPRGRTLPWATGIALAVAATAFISPEPKYGVPTVHVSDNPNAVVVSSVVPEPGAGIRAAEPGVMVAELEDEQPRSRDSMTDPAPEPEPEPMAAEPPPAEQPAPQEPVIEQPAFEEPVIEQPVIEQPAVEEPAPLLPEPKPTLAEPPPEEQAPAPVVTVEPPPPEPLPQPRIPAMAENALLDRGDRLMALGDIASARLLFETAASQGSGRGALAVGRTLDPAYLGSIGVRGVAGDPERAATWYRRAADLGETSAAALLESLGRR